MKNHQTAMSFLMKESASLLDAARLGFKGNLQLVKLTVTVPDNKEKTIALRNISNKLANRFVGSYGGVKVVKSDTELTYLLLISSDLGTLYDVKKSLIFGERFTFDKAKIELIEGKESLVLSSSESYLKALRLMVEALEQRYIQDNKHSYAFLRDKLPVIGLKAA
jgi:hypothetical protein